MNQEVVFRKTSLPPLAREKKRRRGVFNTIFNIVIVILLAILSVSIGYISQIIYNNARYSSFFVNGMSMYPTINRSAYATGNGRTIQLAFDYGNFSNTSYSYRCETGLYDKSQGFLDEIERFDIVCTHYSDDYANGNLESNASAKIKRIIGLPGEWLYYSDNDLMISQDEGETWNEIEETFLQPQSWWGEGEETWYQDLQNNPVNFRNENNPYKLADDEYFVCGDNRRHSNDSRSKGAVKDYMIDGLVVLLNGETNYYFAGQTWATGSGIFDYYLPWKYRYI